MLGRGVSNAQMCLYIVSIPAGNCMSKVNRNTRRKLNMVKVNNKDTRTMPMVLFWCLCC